MANVIKDSVRSFEFTSRATAAQFGVKVTVSDTYHTAASTQTGDGRFVIVMPQNCLDKPSAAGYLDHEAAHCKYTDFKRLMRWLKSGVVDAPEGYAKTWFNVFEDIRIETLQSEDFPGCRRNLEALAHLLFNAGTVKGQPFYPDPAKAVTEGLVDYALWYLQERKYGVAPHSVALWSAISSATGGVLDQTEVDAVLDPVLPCRKQEDVELAVFLMVELIKRAIPNARNQMASSSANRQQQQQQGGQGQRSEGGEGSGSDPDQCAGDQERDGDASQSDADGGSAKGKGRGKGRKRPKAPSKEQRRALSQDAGHQRLMQDMQEAADAKENESDKGRRGFDSVERGEPDGAPSQHEMDGRVGLEDEMQGATVSAAPAQGATEDQISRYDARSLRQNVRGLTGPVLQSLLQTRTVAQCRTGYSGRKLDTRRMTRAAVGDGRIFFTRGQTKMPDTEVIFLLDGSGSMSGSDIVYACAVVYGMQDAVNNLRGFRSQAYVFPCCFGSTCNLTPLDGRHYPTATGSTPTAAAVMLASDRFTGLKARNVMVVVTDGFPDNPPAFDEAVRRVERRDIDVILIGYGCDPAVFCRTGIKSVVADNPRQLADRLRSVLSEIVRK